MRQKPATPAGLAGGARSGRQPTSPALICSQPRVSIYFSPTHGQTDMSNHEELGESHEQYNAACLRYARCSRAGEIIDLGGLCIANSRHPWAMLNAAVLTAPVSS